ncbi:MAG: flagellar protein export ATPase FliI [Pseudomonadota bacterium]
MQPLIDDIARLSTLSAHGRVVGVRGLLVEVAGPVDRMGIGGRVSVRGEGIAPVLCEVVGFRESHALCMAYGPVEGLRPGCEAVLLPGGEYIRPDDGWMGRVVDALGEPLDDKGALPRGAELVPVRAGPPDAHLRAPVGPPLDLGVRALNTFLTCCQGQRMGIFAGSGVGKSVLFSMLARNTDCDVAVIGLIGERGREVSEFINEQLGPEGLRRSIVVVATSDQTALMRRQAAYMTLAVAEHFRNAGKRVLCLMDSVTRFAMAQREIGLAGGEPPTTKGYTPTVFSELPRLLERAGPGTTGGSITGIFTVLVEGDDHNEPVADAVRGILDGHIVMERAIAERGRFPAINVLKSVSRTMPGCVPEDMRPVITEARRVMSTYADMEELIRIGAYRTGTDPEVDRSIALQPSFDAFLGQDIGERQSIGDGYAGLRAILEEQSGTPEADQADS